MDKKDRTLVLCGMLLTASILLFALGVIKLIENDFTGYFNVLGGLLGMMFSWIIVAEYQLKQEIQEARNLDENLS